AEARHAAAEWFRVFTSFRSAFVSAFRLRLSFAVTTRFCFAAGHTIGIQRDAGELEFRGTRRFEILRRLGAGGMGVVYEAIDREKSTHVALKTLRHMNPEGVFRFKNEFRALQDVQHPNLVSLDELIEEEGQWFLTMELVNGCDFLAFVRPLLSLIDP